MNAGSERGAALLEVLIAVAITAMLAAALAQTTRFGLTVVERAQASASGSAEALIARRKLADLLTRMDPEKADRDSAMGDATAFEWHGLGLAKGQARAGVWRLQIIENMGELSTCPALNAPEDCVVLDSIPVSGPFAYAAADGVFLSEWPAGPPPHLVRIGDQVIAPRVLGAP